MSLASVSVKRAVTVSMFYIAVVGFGIFEYAKLPRDVFPDISFPKVVVVTQYAGAGPKDVEKLVTQPIENAVASVEGVKEVTSKSKYGMSVVEVEFSWGTDMFRAETDIRKNIDLFAFALPDDAEKPITFAFDPSLQPVVFMMVNGPYGPAEIRKIAEDLVKPRLERVPGVAAANSAGGLKREIQVELLPERLRALMVAPQQVLQAIRTANVQLPGGAVRQGGQLLAINTQGRFVKVSEIKEVIITQRFGREIRVKDVARVRDWFQEPTRLIRNNGKSSVMVLVRKQSDANTLLVAKAVLQSRSSIERMLPKGTKLEVMWAQSDMINRALGNVVSTGWQAFLLAGLVLLLFLTNGWAAVIVSLAIPISLVVTFPVMNAAHVTLNTISMTGLALAIGLLVDNAIVVIENIYRHMELGKPVREAAVQGAQEVGMAITASTLTTLCVFIPVLFVPGIVGALFKDMVVTICLSITASLIVARTLIPMASSRLLKTQAELDAQRAARSTTARVVIVLLFFWVLWWRPVGRGVQWLLRGFTRGYAALLRVSLHWRKTTLLAALGIFVLSMVMVANLGRDFMPKTDNGMIVLRLSGASGNNLELTSELARDVEDLIQEAVPESDVYSVDLGVGEGIGAVFGSGEYAGLVRIRLPPLKKG
ncbi:MAG: efflux RND transporter permease subunit, partial [bacterium]